MSELDILSLLPLAFHPPGKATVCSCVEIPRNQTWLYLMAGLIDPLPLRDVATSPLLCSAGNRTARGRKNGRRSREVSRQSQRTLKKLQPRGESGFSPAERAAGLREPLCRRNRPRSTPMVPSAPLPAAPPRHLCRDGLFPLLPLPCRAANARLHPSPSPFSAPSSPFSLPSQASRDLIGIFPKEAHGGIFSALGCSRP